jgi:hypothetical protein
LETFTLVFPTSLGAIKEIKLDGTIFKASDSKTFSDGVPSGVPIGPGDWTQTDITKRQLDPNETRTLEVVFSKKASTYKSQFTLKLTFEEGCELEFTPEKKRGLIRRG